jgi:methylmalonyl-CoA mutase N-terminal domain/subunit
VTLEGFLTAAAEDDGGTPEPVSAGGTEFIRAKRREIAEAALARLTDLAGRPGSSETNLMPALIEWAEAYCTLGEMCGVFRAVFGEYREPVAV